MKNLYFLLVLMSLALSSYAQQGKNIPPNTAVHKARTSPFAAARFFQSNLMNKYNINYLKLDFSVFPGNRYITGSCFYTVTTTQPLDTFSIEFRQAMTLDSVFVNNVKRPFTHTGDHIYIAFSPGVAAGTSLGIQFFYKGYPSDGVYTGGGGNGLTFTANVSESFQAREWFPAKQLLNDKIDSADLWITTSTPNIAGSNGVLKNIVELGNNRRQFQWSTRYPMNYYMPAFSVGNYMEYRNYAKPAAMPGDSIPVQHLIVNNPTYFNNVKANLDLTPPFVEKMSELFGLYPFSKEKYGHMHAGIGGGMEHQTMSTMADFPEYLISHELGHQWFGDNVTCATWNDIWLNEGFASYAQVLMLEKLQNLATGTAQQQVIDIQNHAMSSPGGSVYVPLSESYNENRIFDARLSYNKGASVIHTLRFFMESDTSFFNTLKTYQSRFKDSFATTTDFKNVAEEVSGKNLSHFFTEWIYGEGFPTYNITYKKQGPDSLMLTVNQTTSMPSVTPYFHGGVEYKIKSATGDTIIKVNHTENNQTFKVFYTKSPTAIEVDPNHWIMNGVGAVVAAPNNWIVTANKAWENPANWSWGTVPDASNDVVINTGEVVLSSMGACRSLTTNPGAKLTINPGYSLTITK